MGFTVTRQGGTKDVEFEAYARLLRQKGVDLAKLNRVPEPGTGRRWLYVWNVEADAQAFADELKKRTRDQAWEVVQVDAPPSDMHHAVDWEAVFFRVGGKSSSPPRYYCHVLDLKGAGPARHALQGPSGRPGGPAARTGKKMLENRTAFVRFHFVGEKY